MKPIYNSLSEWKKKDSCSYRRACRQGVQRDMAQGFGWTIPNRYESIDDILKFAKKYKSRSEWKKNHSGSYYTAHRMGLIDEVVKKLGWRTMRNSYESIDDIIQFAKKYKSRNEWKKNHYGSYSVAQKSGLIDEIAKKLRMEMYRNRYEDMNDILKFAKKYKSRSEWMTSHSGSYYAAHRMGLVDKVAKKLGWIIQNKYESIKDILEFAKKYKSRSEWQKNHGGSYNAAHRMGLRDEVAKKLGWKKRLVRTHTEQSLIQSAKKSKAKNVSDWNRFDRYAYRAAYRKGFLSKIKRIMKWK